MTRRLTVAMAGAGALAALAGCYQTPQSTLASDELGRVVAVDQPAGAAVTVREIGMPTTGWVAVHRVADGRPDMTGALGQVYVPAGPSLDVAVPLAAPLAAGDRVAVVLHNDTGNARVWEFANGAVEALDLPIERDGAPVMAVVTLN